MSNRNTYHSKLSLKLLMITILAIGVGATVFFGLQRLSEHILDRFFVTSTYLQDKSGAIATEFQSYVTEQKLSTADIEKIAQWVKDKKVVLLDIYLDNHVLYSSSMLDVADMETDSEITFQVWEQVYDIQFKDELAQIKVTGLFDYQIYNYAKMTNLLLAFLAAMITAIIPIKKRINYIDGMEAEVQILEGGDLNYPITVRGNDELTYLADSIDQMRKSFLFRITSEEEIRQANRELITAMSHDLRTPLTTQIGYLEIMKNKVGTEKERQEYLEKCMEKAYQIKNLSDKLFEYFLAFHVEEEEEIVLQQYEGNEVLMQLLREKVFLLEEQGAQVKIIWNEENFFLDLEMEILCRVFDNIFSNISKYADKKKEIIIALLLKKEEIVLTFENDKMENIEKVESTKIGLRNIERMMKKLKGSCSVAQEGNIFLLKLVLPRKTEKK